ncbi:MAG: DinB family protein [Dehalococcoidia bacterium]
MEDASSLRAIAERNAINAIRCLAAAERAVDEGRLNTAKVLRAAALASRGRALIIERSLSVDAMSPLLIATLTEDLHREIEALGGISSPVAALALDVAESVYGVVDTTRRSLERNRDVFEREVAQFLFGCLECGYLVEEQRPDVCPACGSIAAEFELFAPFFSSTSERIARRQPAEIVAMLSEAPGALAGNMAGVPDAILRGRLAAGEWCMKEIAGHMIDIAELFCRRLRSVLDPETPQAAERSPLPWKLLEGQGYEEMTGEELTSRFSVAVDDALSMIATLGTADWRKRVELVSGRVSVLDMGSWLANHNRAHLEQIAAHRSRAD